MAVHIKPPKHYMKIAHIADLHIGANFGGNEKRRAMHIATFMDRSFGSLFGRLTKARPDVVLIAGDIFDSCIPREYERIEFDDFVTAIKANGIDVMCSAGNHDRTFTKIPYSANTHTVKHMEIVDSMRVRDTSHGGYSKKILVLDYLLPMELNRAIENLAQEKGKYECVCMHQSALGFLPQIASPQLDGEKLKIAMESCKYLALGDLHIQKHAASDCGNHIAAYPGNPDFLKRGEVSDNFSFILFDTDEMKLHRVGYEAYQKTVTLRVGGDNMSPDEAKAKLAEMAESYVVIEMEEHPKFGFEIYKELEDEAEGMEKDSGIKFCYLSVKTRAKKEAKKNASATKHDGDSSLEDIVASDSTISKEQKDLALSVWNSYTGSPKSIENVLSENLKGEQNDQG